MPHAEWIKFVVVTLVKKEMMTTQQTPLVIYSSINLNNIETEGTDILLVAL